MRRAGAPVGRQGGWHFGYFQAVQGGFDDHLGGELHTGGIQADRQNAFPAKAPQTTVEIADPDAKKEAANEGQHRVAQVAVQERHGPFFDASFESIAHHQVITLPQFTDKRHEVQKIVTVVRIAHDNVLPFRRPDAAQQRAAVTFRFHIHHPGAQPAGNVPGLVCASVIRDQHFPFNLVLFQEGQGLSDTKADRFLLVQAGHQDGQFCFFCHGECSSFISNRSHKRRNQGY